MRHLCSRAIGPVGRSVRNGERGRFGEQPPVAGMPREVIAERGTRAQNADQPVAQDRITVQCQPEIGIGRHPGQPRESQAGIGRPGQRGQHWPVRTCGRVVAKSELGQKLTGPRRVGKAHGRQLPCQRAAR